MNATTKYKTDSTSAAQHFCASSGFSASDSMTDWQLTTANWYLYDSWNLVQEVREQATGASTNMFVWGIDLSGSLSGVGGVGGLLAILSPDSCLLSPVFDANGNVSEMLSALSSELSILAHYEYSPFGETIVATGDMAKENPYRFSTKYTDDETKLVYYGYRFLSPDLGRWMNRDPIGERGGVNVYAFVRNEPINKFDLWGMNSKTCCSADPASEFACCDEWDQIWEGLSFQDADDCAINIIQQTWWGNFSGGFSLGVGSFLVDLLVAKGVVTATVLTGQALSYAIAYDACTDWYCSSFYTPDCWCLEPGWIWDTWGCGCDGNDIIRDADDKWTHDGDGWPTGPSTDTKWSKRY